MNGQPENIMPPPAIVPCRSIKNYIEQAHSQPFDDGASFPRILDLFRGLKIGVPSGCLGETSILKKIMIDDVTLWPKLESTCKSTRFY